jgi:hypothetical protein
MQPSSSELMPIIVVPGFMGTGLEIEKSPHWKPSTHEKRERVWLNLSKVVGAGGAHKQALLGQQVGIPYNLQSNLFQECDCDDDDSAEAHHNLKARATKNKWVNHVMLADHDKETEGVSLKPIDGPDGIDAMDDIECARETLYSMGMTLDVLHELGYYWKPNCQGNLECLGYDWRFAPQILQQRNGFFDNLQVKVETLYQVNGGKPVMFLAHSMGNKMVKFFLEHVAKKMGEGWIKKFVFFWIAASAPFLGAYQAARCVWMGDRLGPLASVLMEEEGLLFSRSLSSAPWLCPTGHLTKAPTWYVRQESVLEMKDFSIELTGGPEDIGMSTGEDGDSLNSAQLMIQLGWSVLGRARTLHTSVHTAPGQGSDVLRDGKCKFAAAHNEMQFSGPVSAEEIPESAWVEVTIKERGFKSDSLFDPKFSVGAMAMAKEVYHGTASNATAKACTARINLKQLIDSGVPHKDGWVTVNFDPRYRLPFQLCRSSSDLGRVTCKMRWLDFEGVKTHWFAGHQFHNEMWNESRFRLTLEGKEIYEPIAQSLLFKQECPNVWKCWQKYYESDPNYSKTVRAEHDAPPGIERMVSVHGTNMPTDRAFALKIHTSRRQPSLSPGEFVTTNFKLDDEVEFEDTEDYQMGKKPGVDKGIIFEAPEPDPTPACVEKICQKLAATCRNVEQFDSDDEYASLAIDGDDKDDGISGDGVVPLESLEHTRRWQKQMRYYDVQRVPGVGHREIMADARFLMYLRSLLGCPQILPNDRGKGNKMLKVTIAHALNLPNADIATKSDPYATVEIATKPETKQKTRVVYDDLSPQWRQSFVLEDYAVGDSLSFAVWDHDSCSLDDVLGRATLKSAAICQSGYFEGTLQLYRTGKVLKVNGGKIVKDSCDDYEDAEPATLKVRVQFTTSTGESDDEYGTDDDYKPKHTWGELICKAARCRGL